MLTLRAHHINCLFFYRGMGYNPEFTDRMSYIKAMLIHNPNTEIQLICAPDVLCEKCINLLPNQKCISNDKVLGLDQSTIMAYKLETNKLYTFQYIKENIYANFSADKFKKICSDCQWYKEKVCTVELIPTQKEALSITR